MRILIRTSKTARWARRIGSLALPLTVLPVLLHRVRLIDSGTFHVIEQAAMGVAVLGALISILAFARLWHTGDRGWRKAISGFVVSMLCVAPFAYGLSLAMRYPPVTDVSTDLANPLPLASGIAPVALGPDQAAELAKAFPNVRTRRYPLDSVRTFALIEKQAINWGWEIRVRREPVTQFGSASIDAVVTSVLGWHDEVALRVLGNQQETVVDMRSASLFRGGTDLGANGQRIEAFLTGLDTAVQLVLRNSPAVVAPEPEEPPDNSDNNGGQG